VYSALLHRVSGPQRVSGRLFDQDARCSGSACEARSPVVYLEYRVGCYPTILFLGYVATSPSEGTLVEHLGRRLECPHPSLSWEFLNTSHPYFLHGPLLHPTGSRANKVGSVGSLYLAVSERRAAQMHVNLLLDRNGKCSTRVDCVNLGPVTALFAYNKSESQNDRFLHAIAEGKLTLRKYICSPNTGRGNCADSLRPPWAGK
jgi:hypothetical protein